MIEAKRGDHSAYNELVKRYLKYIFAVCMGVLGDCHDAEDLTQDVFIKGFQELRTLKKDEQFQHWLGRIAKNLCVDHIRGNIKMRQVLEQQSNIAADSPRDMKQLREAISELDEVYRTTLMLYYFEGRDCHYVSKVLGVETSTVRTRLSRARQHLREILSRKEAQNG